MLSRKSSWGLRLCSLSRAIKSSSFCFNGTLKCFLYLAAVWIKISLIVALWAAYVHIEETCDGLFKEKYSFNAISKSKQVAGLLRWDSFRRQVKEAVGLRSEEKNHHWRVVRPGGFNILEEEISGREVADVKTWSIRGHGSRKCSHFCAIELPPDVQQVIVVEQFCKFGTQVCGFQNLRSRWAHLI